MNKENQSKTFYKKLGTTGLKALSKAFAQADQTLRIILPLVSADDKILDLGCGYGRISIPLLKLGYDVTGLDFSAEYIAAVKKEARRLKVDGHFRVGDIRRLPFKPKSFSKVLLMWNVFNDFLTEKDRISALSQIRKVLMPGGLAFLETINGESVFNRKLVQPGEPRIIRRLTYGIDKLAYCSTRKDLARLCRKAGIKKFKTEFKIISSRKRIALTIFGC